MFRPQGAEMLHSLGAAVDGGRWLGKFPPGRIDGEIMYYWLVSQE